MISALTLYLLVSVPAPKLLQVLPPEKAILNEMIELRPIEKHHFNLKAPQSCGPFAWIKKTSDTLTCQITETKNFDLVTSTCDDKKSFCLTQTFNVQVLGASNKVTVEPMPTLSATEFKSDHNGFIEDNHVAAFANAKKLNQLVLIDFYGTWCPPCRGLEEYIFSTEGFKKAFAQVTKLKVNIDKAVGVELEEKYSVHSYPTLIVTNAAGEEVARRLGFGYESVNGFLTWWKEIEANPIGLKLLRQQIVTTKEVPESLRNRMLASLKAQRNWNEIEAIAKETKDLKVKEQWSLLAKLGKAKDDDDSKGKQTALEALIAGGGSNVQILDWSMQLLEIEKNSAKKNRIAKRALTTSVNLLNNVNELESEGWSVPDVLEYQADIYENLGDKEQMNSSLRKAELAWAEIAKRGKGETALGPNMWRSNVLNRLEDWGASAEVLKPLVKAYPEEMNLRTRYARALKGLKRYDEALEQTNQALPLSAGIQKFWVQVLAAEIEIAAQKNAEAKNRLEKVLSELSLEETTEKQAQADEGYVLNRVRTLLNQIRTN